MSTKESRTIELLKRTCINGADWDIAKCIALVKQGVDTERTYDYFEATPLILAAQWGKLTLIEALLDAGADPCAVDSQGRTALIKAMIQDHWDIAERLIQTKKGLDIAHKEDEERTPLMWAASFENNAIVKSLIDAGADVNFSNTEGLTALMFAAYNDRLENLKLLIEHGADIHATNKNGFTALKFAEDKNYPEMRDYILDTPHRVEKRRQENRTQATKAFDVGLKTPIPRKRFGGFKPPA